MTAFSPLSSLALTRRSALLGLSAAFTLGGASIALGAAPTDNRLVIFLLRGALDGLSAVQPYGDPDFVSVPPDRRPFCMRWRGITVAAAISRRRITWNAA
jgi:uncharacterized protein (DUF1501 family)